MQNKFDYLKNLTLLLVEDDAELMNNFSTTLSLFFKEVVTAENGAQALHTFNTQVIDMVISDYVMPMMNGHELCSEIRSKNKKIPLVIISNFSDSEKLLKSIPLSLASYLIKPVEYTKLKETLVLMIEKMDDENLLIEHITKTITYNRVTKELYDKQMPILLSKSEVTLLDMLLKHKNTLVSLEMLALQLNPSETITDKAIKNHIYRLRQKIGKHVIVNVPATGYILKENR